jgi:hypothetical protein
LNAAQKINLLDGLSKLHLKPDQSPLDDCINLVLRVISEEDLAPLSLAKLVGAISRFGLPKDTLSAPCLNTIIEKILAQKDELDVSHLSSMAYAMALLDGQYPRGEKRDFNIIRRARAIFETMQKKRKIFQSSISFIKINIEWRTVIFILAIGLSSLNLKEVNPLCLKEVKRLLILVSLPGLLCMVVLL